MTNLVELVARYRNAQTLEEAGEAAEHLVLQVGPKLHLYIAGKVKPDCVDDVYQETLAGLIEGLRRFEGQSDGHFWSYCYRIAGNKCVDQIRREAGEPLEFVDPEDLRQVVQVSARDAVISSKEWEAVERALELLRASKSPCVDYLWARFMLEYDNKMIAETYGLNYDTVHVKLSRCLEKARSLLPTKG